MVDETELRALDPFALFDLEVARVHDHFRHLDDGGWMQPTRCEGWRNREMLSHLRGVELYNEACIADAPGKLMERASTEGGVTDLDSFNAWINSIYADVATDALVGEWHRRALAFVTDLRRRGPDAQLTTMVGPYPVQLQAFHLAMEYATHGDDMGVAVAPGEAPARIDWRARFTRFAIGELEKPVVISSHAGTNTITIDGDTIELSDHDLIEAGQGRLDADAIPESFATALRTV